MIDSRMVCLKWRLGFMTPLALLLMAAGVAAAQQAADEAPSPTTSLMSQFFEHDFVNIFAFGNGTYDTALPQLGSGYGSAWGYSVGGGISAEHKFKDGTFSLSYRGDYRHYFARTYSNGTDQSLSILYTKRLSRHWSLGLQGSGGQIIYGGDFYSASPGVGASVLTNPLSTQSRFANAGLNLTYEQTRRLSYTFGGEFFYSAYNYAGAVNSTGGSGTASVNYRTTARTTVGATYTRTYFTYGQSRGSTSIDGAFLTASHTFPQHWLVSVSAGVSHTHSQGTITQAITLLLGQQLVSGFLIGPYNRTYYAPSFQGTLSRNMHRSLFSISGGQGINAGNGTFLASKDQFVTATYSLTRHLTNFSFGGGYTRLTSVANTISSRYTTANASASYGFNVARYLSANIRYDFLHYDNLYQLQGLNESRFSVGFSFSSKSVPLTLF